MTAQVRHLANAGEQSPDLPCGYNQEEWEQLGEQLGERLDDRPRPTDRTVTLRELRAASVPSSKMSFAGFSRSELEEVIEQTTLEFQGFESLYGFAIHSYESYRILRESPR